jgi:two-component system chemotaxis response regulator CheY
MHAATPTPSCRRPGETTDPSTAILVVDDEPVMLDLIAAIIARIGFTQVDRATDGVAALRMMRKTGYGLVISDLNMRPMSGLQLLRAIRRDAELGRPPFILTTASMQTENAVAAKQLGVSNYLLKPFTPAVLREKIDAVL